MSNIGNPPCDIGAIQSGSWMLAATIIGSAMASIDLTVTNVVLPQVQERLGATAVDAQ